MVGFLSFEKELVLREPWRCSGCSRLMYNLDPRGYPKQGAPIPLYVNNDHKAVCSLCYELHSALDKADWTYWTALPRNKFFRLEPDRYERH